MNGTLQDLRYALRHLRRSPSLTALAVVTLALGIGASTTIFSVVYGVLLRPLPYKDPSRIMAVFEVNTKGAWSRLADPNFDDFRDQNHAFEAIAKYSDGMGLVSDASQTIRTTMASVSPNFLKVFRVEPIIGRGFSVSDAKRGAAPVVIVSYGYWKQYLASSSNVSQLHLTIDHKIFSVIGVLPDGFHFPPDVQLWVPADLDGENPSRTSHNYSAVGRLREGVTVQQAKAEISAIARRIHDSSSDQNDYLLKDAAVVPLRDSMVGEVRPALLVLLGAVLFLLLVACANVANLRLAESSVRGHELAIRSALGAARSRLIRQFITEGFLLSLFAGCLGVLAAYMGVNALAVAAPEELPRVNEVSINIPVLAFAFLLSSLIAVGIGAFTAVRATSGTIRADLAQSTREHAGSRASQQIAQRVVAAQIAITLVLVVGAGLLGRSLINVLEVNPGFRVDRIVTMDVSLPPWDWQDSSTKAKVAVFFRNLIGRLRQIPGMRAVGATSGLPLNGGLPDGMFLLMTQDEVPKVGSLESLARQFDVLFAQKQRIGTSDFCVATAGYFQALGIPLLRGRLFQEHDGPDSPHVAVISDSLARERWPNQDPIGHTIEFGNMDGDVRLLTVIGIVGDVHEYGLDAPPRPTVYVNLFQRPSNPSMTVTMLSTADPQLVSSAARGVLRELDPDIPPIFRTFSQIYSASLGSRKFNLILLGSFGLIALLLATAGVFGVMAYSVSRRAREIGVRVALGASSRDILAMILGQAFRTTLFGIGIGLAGSLALTRTLASALFGVTPTDPLTFAAVAVLLVSAALLACYLPAQRAAKLDPMAALRYE